MTASPGTRHPFRIRTVHVTASLSILFHLFILLMLGYFYHNERPVTADSIQVIYVTTDDQADEVADKKAARLEDKDTPASSYEKTEQKLSERPPELPSFAYPTSMPQHNGASGEPGDAPPPLPGLMSQSGSEETPLPYPTGTPRTSIENQEMAGSGEGGESPGTPLPSGSPGDGAAGRGTPKVAATKVEGCKLFILPLGSSPLAKEKALSLCEGLTPAEERHAKKMEITVSLESEGEPGNITLTRSCGDKRLDEEVQNMLPLMRFDGSTAGEGPLYYLTMILVFSDEKGGKSGNTAAPVNYTQEHK